MTHQDELVAKLIMIGYKRKSKTHLQHDTLHPLNTIRLWPYFTRHNHILYENNKTDLDKLYNIIINALYEQ